MDTMTTDEVAELLHCSTKTLERWRQVGQGPAHIAGVGRRTLYLRTDVEAFLQARRVPATS